MQKLIVALFGLLLAACSSSPPETPPTRVVIWLHAAPNLNPSAAGQAAPLRLRLYELKKDTAFGRADYFALTDNAQSTLGGDLVEQDEFLLRPGEALGGARYVSQVQEVRDDNAAFESRAPVALGSQAFRLLTERDGLGEYAAVGVARVREKRADQALSLDEDYLPPVLDIAAAPPLASFAKELLGLLHQRGEALAGRVVASSAGGASEIADFLLLQLVNRAEALTGHLSRVRPLHPQELYRELVALAGEFCTFTASQRRPEEYPVYNHDDLAASFAPVMLALRQALATVIDAKAIAIPIVEKAYGVHVAMLSDRSLIDNASFVLVVRADVPGESLRGHFPQQAKVGSVEHIRDLVNLQLPGIGLLPMPVAPRQIPYHAGSTYFELDRGSAHWKQLTHSGGFAFHIAGQFPGLNLAFWAIRG